MTDFVLTFSPWNRVGDAMSFNLVGDAMSFATKAEWNDFKKSVEGTELRILIGGEGCDVFEEFRLRMGDDPESKDWSLEAHRERLFAWIEETDAEVTIETRHPENVWPMLPITWNDALEYKESELRGFPPNLTIVVVEECEECEGLGEEVFGDTVRDCSECNGSGEIEREVGT